MGFFKNLDAPTRGDKCRHWKSSDIYYTKTMGFGKSMGKVYHYKLICNECEKSYFVKKDKHVYEQVKDLPWDYTKSYKREFFNTKLNF